MKVRSAQREVRRVPRPVQGLVEPGSFLGVRQPKSASAFSLLEVMLAVVIFFMAVFVVLDLMSQCLRSARALQTPRVDATSLAAELSLTNRLTESGASGDFGDIYPGYTWQQEVSLASTNGLYQVDYIVFNPRQQVESTMSILLYRPDSVVGAAGGINRGRR
jgi:Tfp pilus assembly protein PilV